VNGGGRVVYAYHKMCIIPSLLYHVIYLVKLHIHGCAQSFMITLFCCKSMSICSEFLEIDIIYSHIIAYRYKNCIKQVDNFCDCYISCGRLFCVTYSIIHSFMFWSLISWSLKFLIHLKNQVIKNLQLIYLKLTV